jgi:hypothetical protein
VSAPAVDRHAGLLCGCLLLECCHNEDTDQGQRWRVRAGDCKNRLTSPWPHVHSGSPESGFTRPREPGGEVPSC